MLNGRKLALELAFTVLVAVAFGASCRGFFPKPTLQSLAVGPATPTLQTGPTNNTRQMTAGGTYDDGVLPDSKPKWGITPVPSRNIPTISPCTPLPAANHGPY